jgi:hypothetical protein
MSPAKRPRKAAPKEAPEEDPEDHEGEEAGGDEDSHLEEMPAPKLKRRKKKKSGSVAGREDEVERSIACHRCGNTLPSLNSVSLCRECAKLRLPPLRVEQSNFLANHT